MENYDIESDEIYKDFMQIKADKAENTKKAYKRVLLDICRANELSLYEIYTNCKEEQNDRIVNGVIINFSPNDINTCTKRYFNNFINYISTNKSLYNTKNKKNRSNTINNKVRLLKVFFDKYDLDLPDWEKKDANPKKWYPLKKEDIEYVINDSTLEHRCIWSFMMSTGMRESDCVRWKVRDFMEATKRMGYHNFVNVDEFIDKAPADMIGFWDFHPLKTQKDNVRCMTFNNKESSNYILQALRKIKNEYLPKYNKKNGVNLKISKDSALFGSRKHNYLGHKKPHSVYQAAFKKNKKLQKHHIVKIEEKLAKGEISEEDKEKEINTIPVFHPHQLRRYFITIIRRHAKNLSYAAMMEGHAPLLSNDPSYLDITKEDVKQIYDKAIYELSLYEVDEDAIFDSKSDKLRAEWAEEKAEWAKEKTRLNEKLLKHEQIQQEKDAEIAELKTELVEQTKNIADRLSIVEGQLPHLQNTNPAIVQPLNEPLNIELMMMIHALVEYHQNNEENPQWLDVQIKDLKYRDKRALIDIAYDLVVKEDEIPEALIDLDPFLIKALFKMKKNPELVKEIIRHYNARSLNTQKAMKYTNLLYDLMAEHVVTDEERAEWEAHKKFEKENNVKMIFNSESKMVKVADAIAEKFYSTIDDYLLEEITEDFVMEDIVKFLQSDVDE